MASSLLLLLDDITSVLDDVATMTKVAAKKTAGVLGDDLALNAKQVSGVHPDHELAVVWAVARGSLFNKLVLIPAAIAISSLAPALIPWLLIAGGSFLCFEGVEKILHSLLHRGTAALTQASAAEASPGTTREAARIRGAVRTDFILSAEIVVITLGVVADHPLGTQVGVLAAIGLAMTVGVYGVVAGIVKLDDVGAWLVSSGSWRGQLLGRGILLAMPWLMRALSVGGTAAMFLVGGGIVSHELTWVHHLLEEGQHALLPMVGEGPLASTAGLFLEAGVGLAVGGAMLAAVALARRVATAFRGRGR